jgi:hypothetical protein
MKRPHNVRKLVAWTAVAWMIFGVAPLGVRAETINPPLPDTPEKTAPLKHAISISQPTPVKIATRRRILAVAKSEGATAYPGRAVTLGLVRVSRGEKVVQRFPAGYRVPMSTTVQADEVVRNLMSQEAADALVAGGIVMGKSSAQIRGARVGDVAHLLDIDDVAHAFEIGAIVADDVIGESDLLMSPTQATEMGATMVTRYTIIGFTKTDKMVSALREAGFTDGNTFRIRRTWDPKNPDATLGLGATKKLVGEFAYKVSPSGKITVADSWIRANISPRTPFDGVGVKAACHRVVRVAIQGALKEVEREGLAHLIDTDNTNAYGGCFYPRYNRLAGALGYLSRHSWGMAVDMNTTTNVQGGVPYMDCRIVRIFRKWGFAWGGNFTPSDGMHFEYVGERRDNIKFPSRYCPNIVKSDG